MKRLATIVLCLLPLAGCSGWVVVVSPTAIGCSTNVNIIPSPIRPHQPGTFTSTETVNSACVVADESDVAVAAQGSGRAGVTAEGVSPATLEKKVEDNTVQENSAQ